MKSRSTGSDVTQRQKAILKFIEQTQRQKGYPPSIREIGRKFGIRSTNGVLYHLRVLQREGLLERSEYTSRGMRLSKAAERESTGAVPLVGRVAAGPMSEALEDVERRLELDRALFGLSEQEELFSLRVSGDSMSGAGILEGDIVIVSRSRSPRKGDVVVARMGGEATVKRLGRKGKKILLIPENPAYETIEIHSDREDIEDFSILGVVAGLMRTGV